MPARMSSSTNSASRAGQHLAVGGRRESCSSLEQLLRRGVLHAGHLALVLCAMLLLAPPRRLEPSTFCSPIPAVKSRPSASIRRHRRERGRGRDALGQERRGRERMRAAARRRPRCRSRSMPRRRRSRRRRPRSRRRLRPRVARRAAVARPVVGEQPDAACRRVREVRLVAAGSSRACRGGARPARRRGRRPRGPSGCGRPASRSIAASARARSLRVIRKPF